MDIVSLTFKNNDRSRSQSNSESRSRSLVRRGPFPNRSGLPNANVRCFNCNGPHLKRYCPQLKSGIMKAGAADYRRRSPPRKVIFITRNQKGQRKINQRKRVRAQTRRYVEHA